MWGLKGKRWASNTWLKPWLNKKNKNGFWLADAKYHRTTKKKLVACSAKNRRGGK